MQAYCLERTLGNGQIVTSVTVAGERLVTAGRDNDPDSGPYRIISWDYGMLLVEDRTGRMRVGSGRFLSRRYIPIEFIAEVRLAYDGDAEIVDG